MYRFLHFTCLLLLLSLYCVNCTRESDKSTQIGVVEGFYGTPWTHEARLDMIRFMGEMGMNAYYYAPKDDPYHRSRWREPYSGEHLSRFSELLDVSRVSGVNLYFAISPGLNMVYSDSSDYAALKYKLDDMIRLGVRHLALFLDDVPEYLTNDSDREAFSDLADAHIHLINQLFDGLRSEGIELVVCPTTYTSAWGSREYIQKLGEGIPAEVHLFWTGEDVAVAQITKTETQTWKSIINRKPLLWDNFPVNDFEFWRPIIGPLRGRDAALPAVAEGIIANPMDIPYASMIPLYTVAKYGLNPTDYDPDSAIQEAVRHLGGNDAFPYLMPIIEAYADYGWTDNIFTPVYTPGKPLDADLLYSKLDELEANLKVLSADPFDSHPYLSKLIPELQPFVMKTRKDLDELLKIDREPIIITAGFTQNWDEARLIIDVENDFLNVSLEVFRADPRHEWVLILTGYENPPETWLQPEDLIIRWKLESDQAPRADHIHLTPFSRRGISDIRIRTISSFFAHFLQPSEVNVKSSITDASESRMYNLMVPLPENQRVRFNVFLNPRFTLANQTYLGNPFSYPVLDLN